jgi:hypothetical protein
MEQGEQWWTENGNTIRRISSSEILLAGTPPNYRDMYLQCALSDVILRRRDDSDSLTIPIEESQQNQYLTDLFLVFLSLSLSISTLGIRYAVCVTFCGADGP